MFCPRVAKSFQVINRVIILMGSSMVGNVKLLMGLMLRNIRNIAVKSIFKMSCFITQQ